jgi:hypothetical protein
MSIDYLYHGGKFVSSINVPRHFSFLAADNSAADHHAPRKEKKETLRMDFLGNNYFRRLLFHASALGRRLGRALAFKTTRSRHRCFNGWHSEEGERKIWKMRYLIFFSHFHATLVTCVDKVCQGTSGISFTHTPLVS